MARIAIMLSAIVVGLTAVILRLTPLGATGLQLLHILQPSQAHIDPQRLLQPPAATARPNGDWDIMRHLGGNSPWIVHKSAALPDIDSMLPPNGCEVEQIHMVSVALTVGTFLFVSHCMADFETC